MFPCSSENNRRYTGLGSPKQLGYVSLRHSIVTQFSDVNNIVSRKIGSTASFPICLSTFFITISVIVCKCANKKMFWITTRRIITFVTNALTRFYFSICEGISETVRFDKFFGCWVKSSIPIFVFVTKPIPTLIITSFIDLAPKSFNGICGFNQIGASNTTAWARSQCDIRFGFKWFSTKSAINNYWHISNIAHRPLVVNAMS